MKGIAHRYPNVFDAVFRVTDPLLVLATTFYFPRFFIPHQDDAYTWS